MHAIKTKKEELLGTAYAENISLEIFSLGDDAVMGLRAEWRKRLDRPGGFIREVLCVKEGNTWALYEKEGRVDLPVLRRPQNGASILDTLMKEVMADRRSEEFTFDTLEALREKAQKKIEELMAT